MREQRGWIAAGVLMVLGAFAGAGAVWQHWRTCTGPQAVQDASGTEVMTPLGEACLRAMDDGFSFLYPDGRGAWRAESVFGLALALLVAASWAVVLVSSPWRRSTRVVGAVSLVLVLLVTALNLLPRSETLDSVFTEVQLGLSGSVLLTLVVVVLRDTSSPRDLARIALVLCGPAAVGALAQIADYAFMASVSEANWDTPPWTGTPTLVATALAGATLVVVTLREGRTSRRARLPA